MLAAAVRINIIFLPETRRDSQQKQGGFPACKVLEKSLYTPNSGTAVTQWLRCCATNREVAGSIPAGVSGFFIDIKSFRSHYGPGVDSASNRNEYVPGVFLGGKGGRCVRLTTLSPSCTVVTKCGKLNYLEPSGPLQACNGTDVFFTTSNSPVCFQR